MNQCTVVCESHYKSVGEVFWPIENEDAWIANAPRGKAADVLCIKVARDMIRPASGLECLSESEAIEWYARCLENYKPALAHSAAVPPSDEQTLALFETPDDLQYWHQASSRITVGEPAGSSLPVWTQDIQAIPPSRIIAAIRADWTRRSTAWKVVCAVEGESNLPSVATVAHADIGRLLCGPTYDPTQGVGRSRTQGHVLVESFPSEDQLVRFVTEMLNKDGLADAHWGDSLGYIHGHWLRAMLALIETGRQVHVLNVRAQAVAPYEGGAPLRDALRMHVAAVAGLPMVFFKTFSAYASERVLALEARMYEGKKLELFPEAETQAIAQRVQLGSFLATQFWDTL